MAARARSKSKTTADQPRPSKTPAQPSKVAADVVVPEKHVVTAISVLAMLLVMVVVFFTPRMTGDTFMTIAGGQDVLDGKLGQEDDWAYSTQGRVWINQSWGTGVLFHVAHHWMGYNGIVLIKAVLIALLGLFLMWGAWIFGIRLSVGFLTSAAALFSSRHFIDMRANVVGLTCLALLLCVVYSSGYKRQRIWWSVVLITIWSHMHGSFIFGIGMIGLWTLLDIVVDRGSNRYTFRLTDHLPNIAATCLALLLPAITSPLGITNLTQPFTLLPEFQSEVWPIPAIEMRGVFDNLNKQFSGLRDFFILVGMLCAFAITWCLYHLQVGQSLWRNVSRRRNLELIFTIILVCVAIIMAIKARRFIPVALIVSTPLLALALQWMLTQKPFAWLTVICLPLTIACGPIFKYTWLARSTSTDHASPDVRMTWSAVAGIIICLPLLVALLRWIFQPKNPSSSAIQWFYDARRLPWATAMLAVFMIAITLSVCPRYLDYYAQDHLFLPNHHLFGRMILYQEFPHDAAQFINDNQLSGNIFNEWKWEGFLHLHCPNIKVFLGGRSRQVYPAAAAQHFVRYSSGQNLVQLANNGTRYIVCTNKRSKLFEALLLDPGIPWQVIYYDDNSVIAANRTDSVAQQVIEDSLAQRLNYPSPESAKLCQAIHCLTDKSTATTTTDVMQACEQAIRVAPHGFLAMLLPQAVNQRRVSYRWMVDFLEKELKRLESVDYHYELGGKVLVFRQRAAQLLAKYFASQNQQRCAEFWKNHEQQLQNVVIAERMGTEPPPVDPLPSREELAQLRL